MTCKPEESPNARSAPDAASVLTLVNPVLSQFELTGKPWASWALLGGTVLLLGLVHLLASLLRPAASVWSVGESGVPGRPSMPAAHIVTSVYKSDRDHYCCYQPDSPACDSIPSPLCWCPNPQIANSPGFLPVSLPADPMASSPVVQAALGVAHEFDYPSDQVQRGVQEFIREMHEGLSKHGATLSQIPSYVTSVPNGTEKVTPFFFIFTFDAICFFDAFQPLALVSHGPFFFHPRVLFDHIKSSACLPSLFERRLTLNRDCIWQLILVEPTSGSVPSSSMATAPSLSPSRKSPSPAT